jgi:hypothetical protein
MAVIINELEIVLEPPPPTAQPGGLPPVPEKPQISPQDVFALLERRERNQMRILAH